VLNQALMCVCFAHSSCHSGPCGQHLALLNPETSILIQNCPFYSGSLNSETLGDSQNAFLHWGDVSGSFSSFNAGGGGFGAPEDGEAADYHEGENQGVEKAVADRAAKWVKEHSAAVRSGGSVARYTSEQESA